MSSVVAKEVSDWYNLFRRIMTDLLSLFPREKEARFILYTDLFTVIRFIHSDYISYFQSFIDDLISNAPDSKLDKAKNRFLKARRIHSDQRTLTKSDASNYLSLTDDLAELRFLTSVVWYFHYSDDASHGLRTQTQLDLQTFFAKKDPQGGDGAWNSASIHFWHEIRDLKDGEEARGRAEQLMGAINARFLAIIQSYTGLESSWRLGMRPIQTIVSEGIMKLHLSED